MRHNFRPEEVIIPGQKVLQASIIFNTISMYVSPDETSSVDRLSNSLKPINSDTVVTGIYKDDDTKYSLVNLLKRQEEGEPQ